VNILILLAHPHPHSFNHALARAIADTATQAGHLVWFHDLDAERFDPVLTADELGRDPVLPPDIEAHCTQATQADAIAVVHPNWWSAPPAILRGWVDRCLRAGRAYQFVPDGQGGAKPIGLLKARAGLVVNTANTPQEKELALFGDPLDTHWLKVVFGLCGVPRVLRRNFAPIITSSPNERAQWLTETRSLAAQWLELAQSPAPSQPSA
jgi:NAD(P)H dehydrogenase (quinone)